MMSRLISFLLTTKRRQVQAISFLVMNSYFLDMFKFVPCPGMNCYACPAAIFACPIGTLQHFIIIRQVPVYVLGVLSLIGLGVGRLACGWLCPFGGLQELLYSLRHRPVRAARHGPPPVRRERRRCYATSDEGATRGRDGLRRDSSRRLRWPAWRISERFRWLPYAFLVMLVGIVPLLTYEPWFSKLCPVGTLEAGIPWVLLDVQLRSQVGWLFAVKLLILFAFLIWMPRARSAASCVHWAPSGRRSTA
jgi:polyferredoxin